MRRISILILRRNPRALARGMNAFLGFLLRRKPRALVRGASLLFLSSFVFYCSVFAGTGQNGAKEFKRLKANFDIEISQPPYVLSSDTHKYWDSKAGQEIIAMGKNALPFIMEEIKNGNYWFNSAAEKITYIKMDGVSEQEKSKAWLKWWDVNCNNPRWNLVAREQRTLEIFKTIKKGMNYTQVEKLVGKPDAEIGSGIYIFVYKLSDGSEVTIGFVQLDKPLRYARHVLTDESYIDILSN
ncbi:MAG: hypothetical protein WC450_00110 [Candidatus Omnitrophota bacterium]|jgi:hypothetical protein